MSPTRRHPLSLPLVLACLALVLAACATTPGIDADPATDGPLPLSAANFTLDLVILPGRRAETSTAVHLRRGHYVLFPNGSLHSAHSPTTGPDSRPGLTRRLSREQMAEVWRVAGSLGLTDPAHANYQGSFNVITPGSNELLYMLAITADGRTWRFLQRLDVSNVDPANPDPLLNASPGAAALAALIRHLAALAWETDLPAERSFVMPRRYDFGPDPYAPYRTP